MSHDSGPTGDGKGLEAAFADSLTLTERLRVSTRTYFSIQHIQSAALFARQAAVVEADWTKTSDTSLYSSLLAYATGAIFSATAFLEAIINELFADSGQNLEGHVKGLDAQTIALLAELWNLGIPRRAGYPILDKYQVALTVARKPLFDAAHSPFQDAGILVQLRNNLIHYEPAWVLETDTGAPEAVPTPQLVRKLEGKFAPCPLPLSSPTKFFGHGCAKWSVLSSVEFADEFFKRMGLLAPYDHVRGALSTE